MSFKRRKLASPAEINLNQTRAELPVELWQIVGNYLPSYHHVGSKALQLVDKEFNDTFRDPTIFKKLRTYQSVVDSCIDERDALLVLSDKKFLYQATDDEIINIILKSPDLTIEILDNCHNLPDELLMRACIQHEKVARFLLDSPKFYDLRYDSEFILGCANHLALAYFVLNDKEILNNIDDKTLSKIALLHEEIALFILNTEDLLNTLSKRRLVKILENENIKKIALENQAVRAKFTEEELFIIEKTNDQINAEMVQEAIINNSVSDELFERANNFSAVAKQLATNPKLYSLLSFDQISSLCILYPEIALSVLDNPDFVDQVDVETLSELTSCYDEIALKVINTPDLFEKFNPIAKKLLKLQVLTGTKFEQIVISDINPALFSDVVLNKILSNATLCSKLPIPTSPTTKPNSAWLLLRNQQIREQLSPDILFWWSMKSLKCARFVFSIPSLLSKLCVSHIYRIIVAKPLFAYKILNTPEIWDEMHAFHKDEILYVFDQLEQKRNEIYEIARIKLQSLQPHYPESSHSDKLKFTRVLF